MILSKLLFFVLFLRILFFFKPFYDFSFLCVVLALLSLFIGSIFAIYQYKTRRLLAFSSITNMGFILLSLSSFNFYSWYASLSYFYVYIFGLLSFFCLFFSVRIVNKTTSNFLDNIGDFAGLYQVYPGLAFSFMLLLFSFAGLPPFAGFFGKFFLVSSLLQSNLIFLTFIFLFFTIFAAVYYLYIVTQMFFSVFVKKYFVSSLFLLFVAYFLVCINLFFIFFFDLWFFVFWL